MRSDSLLRACDEFIDLESGGDLLRRLLYAHLHITAPLSNAQIGIALDEACDGIRDRAAEISAETSAERAENDAEVRRA
jgi:hypothetical protein